jgi:hypothetical protein
VGTFDHINRMIGLSLITLSGFQCIISASSSADVVLCELFVSLKFSRFCTVTLKMLFIGRKESFLKNKIIFSAFSKKKKVIVTFHSCFGPKQKCKSFFFLFSKRDSFSFLQCVLCLCRYLSNFQLH